jgi:hypothetical protein
MRRYDFSLICSQGVRGSSPLAALDCVLAFTSKTPIAISSDATLPTAYQL